MSPDASSPGAEAQSEITRTGGVTVGDCARRLVTRQLGPEPSMSRTRRPVTRHPDGTFWRISRFEIKC
jgi:hypothetical protein